jgi:hypothetical protein
MVFISCKDWGVTEIYRQRIAGSSKIIYSYRYISRSLGDDERYYVISDSSESLKTGDKIKDVDLIYGVPIKDTICFVNFNEETNPKNLNAVKEYFKKMDGIVLKIQDYPYVIGETFEYSFQAMEESKDSLTFTGIKKIFGHDLLENFSFPKGSVFLNSNRDTLDYVEIGQLTRKYDYEQKGAKVDSSKLIPYVGSRYYKFYPVEKPYLVRLSDYGIFKRFGSSY